MPHSPDHTYTVTVEWTGNRGPGTASYTAYDRSHRIVAGAKPAIAGSSDPAFRGDPGCWNPEDLLVASLAACHQLWYLHLCAEAGIGVLAYRDQAVGTLSHTEGPARFTSVLLRPHVTIRATDDVALALRLHAQAQARCFIANSVNFPVRHAPTVACAAAAAAG